MVIIIVTTVVVVLFSIDSSILQVTRLDSKVGVGDDDFDDDGDDDDDDGDDDDDDGDDDDDDEHARDKECQQRNLWLTKLWWW